LDVAAGVEDPSPPPPPPPDAIAAAPPTTRTPRPIHTHLLIPVSFTVSIGKVSSAEVIISGGLALIFESF
jgi:hypothetical protein